MQFRSAAHSKECYHYNEMLRLIFKNSKRKSCGMLDIENAPRICPFAVITCIAVCQDLSAFRDFVTKRCDQVHIALMSPRKDFDWVLGQRPLLIEFSWPKPYEIFCLGIRGVQDSCKNSPKPGLSRSFPSKSRG